MKPATCLLLFGLYLLGLSRAQHDDNEDMLPRIAVIGAGLGGTSAAFHLRQLFGPNLQIDIFEANKVGGRTALIDIGGKEYEAGGSIIHKKNKYMVDFASRFNKSANEPSSGDMFFGLCDESGIFFQTSRWEVISLAKLFWRYGLDLYSSQHWTRSLVGEKFERIYEFQEQGIAFTTLRDMLEAMSTDFLNMTRHSLQDVLSDAGLSQRFISELAMAAMRANYGQTTEAHGFVGAVSLVGAEPGLWSVRNGNKQIAEALLKESQANLIEAEVSSVALLNSSKENENVSYEVTYKHTNSDGNITASSKQYDLVIMAAPIFGSKTKVSFVNFPHDVTPFTQDYHTTVAMFVQGTINASSFQAKTRSELPPDLLTTSAGVFFNAVGQQSPVVPDTAAGNVLDTESAVWKTFFNKVPTEEQISQLFDSRKELKLVEWLAYPEYKPKMDLPPFVLYNGLYYINAIESAASAMEMSVIGARNVALLIANQWHGHVDKINEINLPDRHNKKYDL
ncbi:unnamed protein product [Candidula unifasciata]|uniref:Prenylcysteine lyase domain-containing protein n=1 Tax=Candidula unifasciata TaxID=100452 RepID=A0A8S3ZVC2_9EUPU|nr:unnamed protein product [Candidula unifasciata]